MPEGPRLAVQKTYKLYLGGKFPRTESGKYLQARSPRTGELLANYCHASRKDFRDAVVAARKAQPAWAASSAYLKSQILYRCAEMLEGRADSLALALADSTGDSLADARSEVEASIDRLVYFAGWADKYQQVFGTVNPVASPHFNFSTHEPTGVVAALCPDEPSLLGLVSVIAPIILSGNAVVALASQKYPLPAIELAEAWATSDLPGGVVNLLTGPRAEIVPHITTHMDVNAIVDASRDKACRKEIHASSATNLKRVSFRDLAPSGWRGDAGQDAYSILDTVELKTAWHPIGV